MAVSFNCCPVAPFLSVICLFCMYCEQYLNLGVKICVSKIDFLHPRPHPLKMHTTPSGDFYYRPFEVRRWFPCYSFFICFVDITSCLKSNFVIARCKAVHFAFCFVFCVSHDKFLFIEKKQNKKTILTRCFMATVSTLNTCESVHNRCYLRNRSVLAVIC